MKRIFSAVLLVVLVYSSTASAAYQVINNGEGGLSVRTKMNNMHSELYAPDSTAYTPITPPAQVEGLLFYDSTTNTHVTYNDISGSSLQHGRELWARSCNNTGVTLDNGNVVYISGIDTGCPEAALAQPDEFVKSRMIGVVTQGILEAGQGEVTSYGRVKDIPTNTLTAGLPVYLTDDGLLTSTIPTGHDYMIIVGTCLVSDATNGSIFVNPYVASTTVEVTDTNGFADRTNSTMAFVDGSLTFSIAPTATEFYYYIDGKSVKRTGTDSVIIDDIEGLHVIYYDIDGNLVSVANPNAGQVSVVIRTKALLAYIYWDTENDVSTYFADERHGISMSPQTHTYLHYTQGAKFLQGLAAGDFDIDGSGDDNTAAQFSVAAGLIVDEDITTTAAAIVGTTGAPIYYLDGATGNMRRIVNTGYSVLDDITAGTDITGRLVYNEWTGATWQLTTVSSNAYVLAHIFTANGLAGEDQTIAVIGQAEYINISQARAGASTEISSILTLFPQEEIVPVATVVYQTVTAYLNDVKARTRTAALGEPYVDWRTTDLAQGVAASSHNNLTDLELATTGATWGHIDDQAQTIYGIKTFNAFPVGPTAAPTADYQLANKKYVDDNSGGSGDATLAGDQEFTGANIFSGTTQLNRLGNIIFSDGVENMSSEPFAFTANRTLKILDYDSQIAADALLDDTTGLLAVETVDSDQYVDGSIDAAHLSTSAQVVNTITSFSSPTVANPYTLAAANSYNAKVYYGATGEIDLPALADGMAVVIYNTGAFTITMDPNASEVVVRDGTAQTGGVSFTLSSGAGNFVCLVSDGTQWVTLGFKGTLAVGT